MKTNQTLKIFPYILILILFYSCQTKYVVNDQGGIRPKNKNMFRYNNKSFALQDNQLIDTNYIYLRKDAINNYGSDSVKSPTVYYRFWGNGCVQEVWPDNQKLNSIVNNTEIGNIGYYYIKKGRLKIEIIETTNGGQAGHRYGLFDNGDIWFYEQTPETYFGSWNMLKWLESKNKTRWVKTKVDSLGYIKPTW